MNESAKLRKIEGFSIPLDQGYPQFYTNITNKRGRFTTGLFCSNIFSTFHQGITRKVWAPFPTLTFAPCFFKAGASPFVTDQNSTAPLPFPYSKNS